MNEALLEQAAKQLSQMLSARGERLVTVESCTGGWVAKLLTDLPGSSAVLEGGFVTYSNQAKQSMVGVSIDTLVRYGAVSEQTAAEMAQGALTHSEAEFALSITGVAGPDGGSEEKPVGMVCFGWASRQGLLNTEACYFSGDRQSIRAQSVLHALQGVESRLG